MQFIYVFNKEDKEELLRKGYSLLKTDEKNNIYIFKNDKRIFKDMSSVQYTLSNVLTF